MIQNNKTPKVSICVITYNHEKYIQQCLQSIVDQVIDFNFEVIVSDDCSTDKTQEIIRAFTKSYPFIIPILRKENIGGSQNFIDTHNMARGEYVCHMDGDDYWLPNKLQYQVGILDNNSKIVQCWTFAKLVDDNGCFLKKFPSVLAFYLYPKYVTSENIALTYSLVGHHSTQMYRKKVRDKFFFEGELMDYKVAFFISLSGSSYYSKKTYSAYRVTETKSITRTKSKKKTTVCILSQHLVELANKYPKYAEEIKANLLIRLFFSYLRNHDLDIIKKEIGKLKGVNIKFSLIIKSCYYFLLEKI